MAHETQPVPGFPFEAPRHGNNSAAKTARGLPPAGLCCRRRRPHSRNTAAIPTSSLPPSFGESRRCWPEAGLHRTSVLPVAGDAVAPATPLELEIESATEGEGAAAAVA